MKIDKNTNIFHQNIAYAKDIKKGDMLTGKIIDIKGKLLLLHINELGIINATSEENLKSYIGKEMTFIVESLNEKIIKIKPNKYGINIEQNLKVLYKKEEYIENVLKEFNIKRNQLNTEYIKSLMEYSVKLDEDNILNGINLLNNLRSMMEFYEEEKHIGNEFEYMNIIKDNIVEENHILISDYIIQLKYLLKDKGVNLLPKTVAFFIKYNIKPSLNNINNFIELNLDTELFLEDYEILKDIINKEFTNHYKTIIIGNESPRNLIEESRNIYLNYVDQIIKFLGKENIKAHKEINRVFKRFESKLKLIKELNKGLTFIYLPIELNRDLNSIITLIKKKRHRYDYHDAINVLISLKTANFGKIRICLKVINSDMRIEFSNLDREDVDYFKSKEEYLISIVESVGYNVTSIDYVGRSNLNILNILTVNSNPLYCLDVKV